MGIKVDYANSIKGVDLDTIYITAGGYVRYPFKGIARDSLWGIDERVFSGELTRSRGDFVLTNIEDVDFGIVSRGEINLKYLNAKDYVVLCELLKQRVWVADFFNRDKGQRETREVAVTNQERGNIYNYGANEYIGNFDIKINFVATNRELKDKYRQSLVITYNANGGTGSLPTQNVKWSSNAKIYGSTVVVDTATYSIVNGDKILKYWATKKPNSNDFDRFFVPDTTNTFWESLNLYAIWE